MKTRIFETDVSIRAHTEFPGNSSIVISHNMKMKPDYIGKGFAHEEQTRSLAFMKRGGYKYALCCVNYKNNAQIKILRKAGWKKLDTFYNDCTCEFTILFGKDLTSRE